MSNVATSTPEKPRPRRRVPGRARTSEQARAAVTARWERSADERLIASVKKLVDKAPPLTPEQIAKLRGLFSASDSGQEASRP